MKLLFLPIAMVLILAGCDAPNGGANIEREAAAEAVKLHAQAEADAIRKQTDSNVAMQKHLEQIQNDVVKACLAHDGVPVLAQGQVMCQKGPR